MFQKLCCNENNIFLSYFYQINWAIEIYLINNCSGYSGFMITVDMNRDIRASTKYTIHFFVFVIFY
jgi:hypothetical protein